MEKVADDDFNYSPCLACMAITRPENLECEECETFKIHFLERLRHGKQI